MAKKKRFSYTTPRPGLGTAIAADGGAGPDSQLQGYSQPAPAVPAQDSRPAMPHPGTPDEAAMATPQISGPPPRNATIRTSSHNNRPRPLNAHGGPSLNGKPGVPPSPPGARWE